jgi:hypothetical protein
VAIESAALDFDGPPVATANRHQLSIFCAHFVGFVENGIGLLQSSWSQRRGQIAWAKSSAYRAR